MAFNQAGHEETGLIEALYTASHEAFTMHCKNLEIYPLPEVDKPRFEEQAGRFYLWGEAFYEGHIDAILKISPSTHLTIVRFLTAVAGLLLSSKFISWVSNVSLY